MDILVFALTVALLIVLIAAQRHDDGPIPTRPGLLLPEDV